MEFEKLYFCVRFSLINSFKFIFAPLESVLVCNKLSSKRLFCLFILSFTFWGYNLAASVYGHDHAFYGIKDVPRPKESLGFPSAVNRFWEDKGSRYSSISKIDLTKSPKKIEKYKGHYNAFSIVEDSFYGIEFVYYRPQLRDGEKAPLIIIVPAVVGITPMDYLTANYFANNGFGAVVLKLNIPSADIDFKLEEVGSRWENYVDKVRAFIDVAHELPGVDVKRIGIKGVSLGGITAAIAMGRDPRIKASVIYMGGVDLPKIMANSEQPLAKKIRLKKMEELNLETNKEYEEVLKRKVKLELPFLMDGRKVEDYYLFIVLEDDYVPGEVQLNLRKKLGFPEALFLDKGHLMNGIFYSLHLNKMKKYFQKRFSLSTHLN